MRLHATMHATYGTSATDLAAFTPRDAGLDGANPQLGRFSLPCLTGTAGHDPTGRIKMPVWMAIRRRRPSGGGATACQGIERWAFSATAGPPAAFRPGWP
jgi:hypothetical protein